jgi:Holliday junction resolvasome RuvABC DNA-binding subunit
MGDIYEIIERAQMLRRVSAVRGINSKVAIRICRDCGGKIANLVLKLSDGTLNVDGLGERKIGKLKGEFLI